MVSRGIGFVRRCRGQRRTRPYTCRDHYHNHPRRAAIYQENYDCVLRIPTLIAIGSFLGMRPCMRYGSSDTVSRSLVLDALYAPKYGKTIFRKGLAKRAPFFADNKQLCKKSELFVRRMKNQTHEDDTNDKATSEIDPGSPVCSEPASLCLSELIDEALADDF